MANNVGNISVGLSLSNEQFALKMSESTAITERFTQRAAMAGAAAAGASGGLSRFSGSAASLAPVMQQSAFALGDFASQVSTRGIGGGLQAAANNIQQLGASFGPMGLAVTAGVGVAATAIGVLIEQYGKQQKKTEELADKNAKLWKRIADDAKNGATEWRKATRIALGQDADIAANRDGMGFDAAGNQLEDVRKQIESLRRERSALETEFNRSVPFKIGNVAGPSRQIAQRVGLSLPGGFRSISEADSRVGPIFSRALGRRAVEQGLISPQQFKVLADLEKKFISLNDTLGQLQRRETALGQANTGENELERRRRMEADMQGISQGTLSAERERVLRRFGTEEQKRAFADRDRERSAILRSFETPQDRFNRERDSILDANKRGVINAAEANKAIDKLSSELESRNTEAARTRQVLPSFEANSQETLSRINQIIRGTRDTKIVEKNTADTAKAAAKLVGKMEDVRAAISRNSTKIARF